MDGVIMMTLKTCWEQLSSEVQRKIANHHQGVPIEALPEQLIDATYWKSYIKSLQQEEYHVMHWWAVQKGGAKLTFTEMRQMALPLAPVHFRLALLRLRQRGLIYAGRTGWGESACILPEDVRDTWLAVALPEESEVVEGIELSYLAPPGLLPDLFHFLVMVDRDAMTLTQTGQVHQRTKQKWSVELDLQEDGWKDVQWLAKEKAQSSFDVVAFFAEQTDLTQFWAGRELRLNHDRLHAWLSQTVQEATRDLYGHAREAMRQVRPDCTAVLWWMERQQGWVSLRHMALYWCQQFGIAEREWQSWANRWEQFCLKPFHALGWIDWGKSGAGSCWKWSAWSPFGESMDERPIGGYIQPNFEWLIPLHFPLSLRWKAAQFADLVHIAQMCTYELNEASIRRGIQKGWRTADMITFLNTYSLTPVPQNVQVSMQQWGERKEHIHVEPVVLLTVHDDELAQALSQNPEWDSLVREQVDETTFVVSPSGAASVQERLSAAGYEWIDPEGVVTGESVSNSRPPSNGTSVTWRVEDAYPTVDDAIPGLSRLPKLWTNDLRPYHPTTLRDIVRHALELQVEVEWQRRDLNEQETFRPMRLRNIGGQWQVEGHDVHDQRRQYTLDSIEAIRIKTPTLS